MRIDARQETVADSALDACLIGYQNPSLPLARIQMRIAIR